MYAILTLRMGLPPSYVLDEMEMYEVSALFEYEYYAHKDDWEQTRFLAYITAQTQSTKKLKPDEILPLYWENGPTEVEEITDDIKKRLNEKAKQWQKTLQQG